MNKLPKLAPYLVVNGGLAAIKFYEDAFDADTQFLMMAEDGKHVMHATLEVNDGIIYLCDDFGEGGKPAAKGKAAPASNSAVMIHLNLKKPKHVDAMMQQAVEHGAQIAMPAEDAFWGDRYGQIRDPFGHIWAFGAVLKPKDQMPAEMPKAPQAEKTSIPKNRARGSKN